MQDSSIKNLVQAQFGAVAERYVTSAIHAHGSDLARMIELAQPQGDERLLDIATGGGHTALAFAPHVRAVVATDLTPRMLKVAQAFIREQGAANVTFQLADAEALPFADVDFDMVTTRIAPHHFPNPQQYVREVARVLKPGGLFVLDDNMAPDDQELDAFLNRFEQWRDPGHVRNNTVAEWSAWMQEAGLLIEDVEPLQSKRYEFASWTEQMRMPATERGALEAWLIAAPPHCAEFFQIVIANGCVQSLTGRYGMIVARRGE
ncbi:MAG: methyltransferase domain-containing protein [Chloroflexota bacterium]|nr:methyltransferase domain-containing protein [Chloroflexota bacterium]